MNSTKNLGMLVTQTDFFNNTDANSSDQMSPYLPASPVTMVAMVAFSNPSNAIPATPMNSKRGWTEKNGDLPAAKRQFRPRNLFGETQETPAEFHQSTFIKPLYPPKTDFYGLPHFCKTTYRSLESVKNTFLKNAIDIQQSYPIKCTLENGSVISLEVNRACMTGMHCLIASIASNQPQAVTGISNDQVLLKTFRDYSILANSDGAAQVTADAAENVLEQYTQMKEHNIPVMEIYNYDNAKSGCGYFLVENVPHELNVTWKKGDKIGDLSKEQRRVLDEVRDLFEMTYKASIFADLQPNNLRRREDGTLVFIDLREDKPERWEMIIDFKKMPRHFECREGDEIYNYLLPSALKPTTNNQS